MDAVEVLKLLGVERENPAVKADLNRLRQSMLSTNRNPSMVSLLQIMYLSTTPGTDPETFQRSFSIHAKRLNVKLDNVFPEALNLWRGTVDAFRHLGWQGILACSHSGHEEATISAVRRYIREEARHPGTLRLEQAREAVVRLVTIAKTNFRAQVLLGQLAQKQGRTKEAINYYEGAMHAATEMANQPTKDVKTPLQHAQRYDELSTPWTELAHLYYNKGRIEDTRWVLRIGVELNDPDAYYNRAKLEHELDPDRTRRPDRQDTHSLDWLHDMTRAAASGNLHAALEVGRYYANEKPHPIPPMSFPEESISISAGRSPHFLDIFRSWAVFSWLSTPRSTHSDIEYHASLMQMPVERVGLAFTWLRVACDHGYPPAFVDAARLFLKKIIYPEGNLSNPDKHPDSQRIDDFDGGVESRLYSVQHARRVLTELFVLKRSLQAKDAATQRAKKMISEVPDHHPQIADAIDTRIDQTIEDAMALADTVGMDLADKGRLLYKHRGDRGKGVYECSPEDLEKLTVET